MKLDNDLDFLNYEKVFFMEKVPETDQELIP